jgi:hypothetical protein
MPRIMVRKIPARIANRMESMARFVGAVCRIPKPRCVNHADLSFLRLTVSPSVKTSTDRIDDGVLPFVAPLKQGILTARRRKRGCPLLSSRGTADRQVWSDLRLPLYPPIAARLKSALLRAVNRVAGMFPNDKYHRAQLMVMERLLGIIPHLTRN